jgi:rRNA-processing protein FCF1
MTTPRLLDPAMLDTCLEALRRAAMDAGNISSNSLTASDYVTNFMRWHAASERVLSFLLTADDLHRLLFSPRYWALRQMDATAPSVIDWVELEVRRCIGALEDAVTSLDLAKHRWRKDDATLVMPDTNLLMHHDKTLSHIPWRDLAQVVGNVRVVLALQVIDELDRLKRTGKDPVRARKTLRELSDANIVGTTRRHGVEESEYAATTFEVFADDLDHVRLADPDSEIVDRAAALGELAGRRVIVLTSDVGMQVRSGEAAVDVRLIETS